jgi:hypothetical protein
MALKKDDVAPESATSQVKVKVFNKNPMPIYRARLRLEPGKWTELSVTTEQLKALQADAGLTVDEVK